MRHATALGAAVVAGLGAIAGTVWVGSQVREETVVAQPYEEGLEYDRERHAREALGWAVEVGEAPAAGASAPLSFTVRDRRGGPVDAAVTLTFGRPDTSRGQWRAEAMPGGGGAYRVEPRFPAPGPWEIRFDVRRGQERARLTRTVQVPAARGACELGAGPCTAPLSGGGEVTLALGPRPLRAMADLAVTAEVREGGAPLEGAVSVRFEMKGMQMFPAEARLAPAGPGRHAGRAVLVRCPSGRRDWTATVVVTPAGGAPRTAELPLEVAE